MTDLAMEGGEGVEAEQPKRKKRLRKKMRKVAATAADDGTAARDTSGEGMQVDERPASPVL